MNKIKELAKRGIYLKSDASVIDVHDNEVVNIQTSNKVSVGDDFEAFERRYMQENEGEIVSVYDRHAGLVDGAKWMKEQMTESKVDYNKFEKLFADFCERNKGHHITTHDACMWFWEHKAQKGE